MKNKILIVAILAVVIGGYFLFGNIFQSPSSKENNIEDFTVEQLKPSEQKEIPQVREISVSGDEFSFNPSSIQLESGERIKLVFTNVGKAPHDLKIEELGIGTEIIRSGQTDTIEFQAPKSGKYTFFCSVAGHREAGMEGNLEVK
ncbi:MAG: cupredoxin domain-containing protein [Patescibacteria group bacterium]